MILKDMRFAVNDSQLRVLFNMVDLSGNGSISKTEFIQGFYALMRQLVPNIILNSLSVLPEQIASHILKALMFLLLLFAFLFVSMDALTPSAADVDFMGGVQAVVAGMAALGVRVQSTSGMDLQSIKAPRPSKIMTQVFTWGFHSHGCTPIAGWFIRENPSYKWMISGSPHLWKPPNSN